ncbi:MAG: lipid-A-disaccharide synthase [Campylobacterales bacterium]
MKLFCSALDPSGNRHLSKLLKEGEERGKQLSYTGLFSSQLTSKRGAPILPTEELAVMGFWELLPKLSLFRRALREGVEGALQADKVLLIDAPSFNLRLAEEIHRKGGKRPPIYYYILPKVWAWKRERIRKVEELTDFQLYIFPFERLFWKRGIYIGNPILEEVECPSKELLYRRKESRIIAFLPGSRPMEIKRLMPLFRELNRRLVQKGFEGELVVPLHLFPPPREIYGDISQFILSTSPRDSLRKARFGFICSGTATLEGALTGLPLALLYRASWVDYWIGRTFVTGISHIGLANIIGEFEGWGELHPEYLQKFPIEELVQLPFSPNFSAAHTSALRLWDYFQKPATPNLLPLLFNPNSPT